VGEQMGLNVEVKSIEPAQGGRDHYYNPSTTGSWTSGRVPLRSDRVLADMLRLVIRIGRIDTRKNNAAGGELESEIHQSVPFV